MPARLPRSSIRPNWWWVFLLLIALPAATLAVLGLRGLKADEVDRQQRLRNQQTQIGRLADSALLTALERELAGGRARGENSASDDLPSRGTEDAVFFRIDEAGAVSFPQERVSSKTHPAAVDPTALALVMRVQAADAQGRTAEAAAVLSRLRDVPGLEAWARFQTLLLDSRPDVHPGPLADAAWGVSTGRSPAGIPVAIVASSLNESYPTKLKPTFEPLLSATLMNLRAGRWWLSFDQRRVYDRDLVRWLREIGSIQNAAAEERRLDWLCSIAESISRAVTATRTVPPRAEVLEAGSGTLVIWARRSPTSPLSSGVVLSAAYGRRLLDAVLAPMFREQPFHSVLRATDVVLWGNQSNADPATTLPLNSLPGWSLTFSDPDEAPGTSDRRWLNYARVAFPLLVLTCGLVMTAWIVNREMALTRLKGTFVASVTHEFKSPITSIRLLMERIAAGRVDDPLVRPRYYAAVRSELDRLEGMVNRLLETQKMEAGRKHFTFEPVALDRLAREVIEQVRPHADSRSIAIEVQIDPALPIVAADRDAVSGALRNLLDNAIKYSADGQKIAVSVEATATWVQINVVDEGIGVLAEDAERIFEPFVRSHHGDAANVHGSGLGLALVRATADAHGGTATVTSDGERGSRFTLTLPMRQEPDAETVASSARS